MRVRMRIQIAGDRNGQPWPPKDGEIDVPDAEAAELIRNHYAVEIAPEIETATAVSQDVETRPAPKTPKRRGGLTKSSSGLNPPKE